MESGGIGSWATSKYVVNLKMRPGDRFIRLFADTLMEDPDLYRFLEESGRNIGVGEHVRISDGRDPWQVFFDVRYLGNTRIDPCSFHLKRKLMRAWLENNCDPATTVAYIGIDAGEEHRYHDAKRYWEPWTIEAPLIEAGIVFKSVLFGMLADEGIAPPALYAMGMPHNNCGGFCIKGGIDHFILLLNGDRDRYRFHEHRERQLRRYLGHTEPCRASNPRPLGWNSEKQESWLDDPGCACPVRDVSILRDRSVKTITRRLGLTTDDLTRDVDENGKKGWWTVTATGEPLPKILPLTLERLRQRVEGGEDSGSDGLDVGGCNCVNPDASVDAEIEGLVALPFPTVRGAA